MGNSGIHGDDSQGDKEWETSMMWELWLFVLLNAKSELSSQLQNQPSPDWINHESSFS